MSVAPVTRIEICVEDVSLFCNSFKNFTSSLMRKSGRSSGMQCPIMIPVTPEIQTYLDAMTVYFKGALIAS